MAVGLDTNSRPNGLKGFRVLGKIPVAVVRQFRLAAEFLMLAETHLRRSGMESIQGPARGLVPIPVRPSNHRDQFRR